MGHINKVYLNPLSSLLILIPNGQDLGRDSHVFFWSHPQFDEVALLSTGSHLATAPCATHGG